LRYSPFLFASCRAIPIVFVGCSTAASNSGADSGVFVATASSFSGFHSWYSTPGVGPPGAPNPSEATDGGVHAGTMTTYINQKPPSGSTEFPVGTIIVKEENNVPLTSRQIFAMVKRGGGYNTSGAVNWQWFELHNNTDGETVTIVWQTIPIASEPYAANPNLCNDCHVMAKSNDYVWTVGLSLASF
jgi:hypothetical protein